MHPNSPYPGHWPTMNPDAPQMMVIKAESGAAESQVEARYKALNAAE